MKAVEPGFPLTIKSGGATAEAGGQGGEGCLFGAATLTAVREPDNGQEALHQVPLTPQVYPEIIHINHNTWFLVVFI